LTGCSVPYDDEVAAIASISVVILCSKLAGEYRGINLEGMTAYSYRFALSGAFSPSLTDSTGYRNVAGDDRLASAALARVAVWPQYPQSSYGRQLWVPVQGIEEEA
jgi:hypothetical protein